jgi:hypothetical protein
VDGFYQEQSASKSHERGEAFGGFLATHGNPLEPFEFADGLLDPGAPLVELLQVTRTASAACRSPSSATHSRAPISAPHRRGIIVSSATLRGSETLAADMPFGTCFSTDGANRSFGWG